MLVTGRGLAPASLPFMPHLSSLSRFLVSVLTLALLGGTGVMAQSDHAHMASPPESHAWRGSWDANVFLDWNYQERKFTDFQRVESQNWLMLGTERGVGQGRIRLHTMLSFEPFTVQPLGSPQVFQTGETYKQAPLIDYQHPHDLFMDLGVSYSRPVGQRTLLADVLVVGSPALGPPAFMHRPSAADNPTAPLGHHEMDATHISHGVVTGGVRQGEFTLEGSWFRGAEPDENRKDIELGKLDSYSGRVSWRRAAWDAQVSAAHLTTPEFVEPFSDVTRLTASIGYTRPDGRVAALLAWGQNREIHGNLDAYLFEATVRSQGRQTWYTRLELTTKDILNAGGRHPPGIVHFHALSRVGAFTGGYVFDIVDSRAGLFGLGGDATVYHVPDNLLDNYGAPASFHVFLRYRPRRTTMANMVH
jgi:hypothetical protein